MSGLLDKAKTTSTVDEKKVKAEVKPNKKSSDGLLTKAEPVPQKTKPTKAILNDSDGPDIPMILNLSGWIVIVLGAIFSLQGGGFGLIVVLIVLALGIGSIVQCGTGFHHRCRSICCDNDSSNQRINGGD